MCWSTCTCHCHIQIQIQEWTTALQPGSHALLKATFTLPNKPADILCTKYPPVPVLESYTFLTQWSLTEFLGWVLLEWQVRCCLSICNYLYICRPDMVIGYIIALSQDGIGSSFKPVTHTYLGDDIPVVRPHRSWTTTMSSQTLY